MKTTINLTIHAPSKKAAKTCLDFLLCAWDILHRFGEVPIGVFLGCGGPKMVKSRKGKPK